MLQYLQKPYFLNADWQLAFKKAFWFGLFVSGFLLVFKPFGLVAASHSALWLYGSFGIITAIIMLFLSLVLSLNPFNFFNDETWNVAKELTWNLVHLFLIGCGNYLFYTLWASIHFNFGNFLFFQLSTLLVGIFPILFFTLL